MNIYIGNLPYSIQEQEVRELFEEYGDVTSVKLITDRESGRLKGFGFVEIDDAAGEKAIEDLNGQEMGGRTLKVNAARDKEPRQSFNR